MKALEIKDINGFDNFLKGFRLDPSQRSIESFCGDDVERTEVLERRIEDHNVRKYVNEFWTSKQRQANSIHEISYRACFKPQLPNFFIRLLTKQKDIVYDPFSGRGTTAIEAALLNRNIAANDINPLSEILTAPRLNPPFLKEVELRLKEISLNRKSKADIDLTMFYHPDTEGEIVSLKSYLTEKKESGNEDKTDKWIRMIATNRLTGHSRGFFSVYTLPPNQAVSPERQKTINKMRDQKPEYRNIKKIILGKSKSLLRDLTNDQKNILNTVYLKRLLLTEDARNTPEIESGSVKLLVTSPPFLDIVQYSSDNWLRCWFNNIDIQDVSKKITMSRTVKNWAKFMREAFREFHRILAIGGWIAFEVGEVRKGSIELDEIIVPIGIKAGFSCAGVLINSQKFTKTANIWGVKNNSYGTNTNRVVLFCKKQKP